MNKATITQLFDAALRLKKNEEITIPCVSLAEQTYTSSRLYVERANYNKLHLTEKTNIEISRSKNDIDNSLVVRVKNPDVFLSNITVTKADGTTTPLFVDLGKPKEEKEEREETEEDSRIRSMMQADGCTEEEITEVLNS